MSFQLYNDGSPWPESWAELEGALDPLPLPGTCGACGAEAVVMDQDGIERCAQCAEDEVAS